MKDKDSAIEHLKLSRKRYEQILNTDLKESLFLWTDRDGDKPDLELLLKVLIVGYLSNRAKRPLHLTTGEIIHALDTNTRWVRMIIDEAYADEKTYSRKKIDLEVFFKKGDEN